MKKTILILLFGLLTVVGLPMVTEAAEPVDATDATIFGAQAMVPNSTEDGHYFYHREVMLCQKILRFLQIIN